MKLRGSCAGALVLGVSLAARAPVQPPAPAVSPQPFRAGTLVVEVDAIVTDASGRFVPGLTADDFTVREDGGVQRIVHVYTVSGRTVTPDPAAYRESAPALVPSPASRRVFILLFDQEHMRQGSFKRLQSAALEFLATQFATPDVGGIVVGNQMVGNQLTSDRDALVAAVRDAKPDFSKTSRRLELLQWPRFNGEAEAIRIAQGHDPDLLARVVDRACADEPDLCRQGRDAVEGVVVNRARAHVADLRTPASRTLRTLGALASGLARFPGRKTIILMTDGFFVDESSSELRQIVGAAARSNVRIYSVDARGLDTRPLADPRQAAAAEPDSGLLETYDTLEDGPNILAVDTGGYRIRHSNDFADALAGIARDTSRYYVIGYEPSNEVLDGGFRTIAVTVKREGLKVRARRGYLATAGSVTTSTAGTVTHPSDHTVFAPPAASDEPPPSTSPVAPLPAADTNTPTTPSTATGVALRPDSSERVAALASRDGAEPDESLASRGWERYRKGDLEGAAALLEQATADPNVRPWVRYALGYSEFGLQRPARAAEEWEKVRAAVPEFRPVYQDLADAYSQIRNYGRAIEVLEAAAGRWPDDPDVLNALGTIQVKRGALGDAVETFRRATEAFPRDSLAYLNLGRTYELRYFKTRRYSRDEARWLANQADLEHAIASYRQYVNLGGPYLAQARQALENLQWLR